MHPKKAFNKRARSKVKRRNRPTPSGPPVGRPNPQYNPTGSKHARSESRKLNRGKYLKCGSIRSMLKRENKSRPHVPK